MDKPAICEVLHSLTVGGAEVLAARLAYQLGDRFRFVFACLDDVGELGTQLEQDGFPVHLLGRKEGFDIGCARRLARFLRDQRVDVVHAHQYTPFFYSMLARLWGARQPVLFTEHGRFFPDYPRRKRMVFNRVMLRRRDHVIGVGEHVRRALIDNEGIPAARTDVIYNGVELTAYQTSPSADERAEIRHEIGVEADDFVLIQVARLDHLKDHATAIRTMARVVEQVPQARLIIVGEGPERPKIEAEIARRDAGAAVRLLGTRRDVGRLLGAADVCLLTSISEGIPLTLIEGMAAGLPVVSTSVGGIPEVVVHDECGLLTPSGDDAALAAAVAKLAADPERRRRLGGVGRRRAEEIFSEERMHDRYEALFRSMSGGGSAAVPELSATR